MLSASTAVLCWTIIKAKPCLISPGEGGVHTLLRNWNYIPPYFILGLSHSLYVVWNLQCHETIRIFLWLESRYSPLGALPLEVSTLRFRINSQGSTDFGILQRPSDTDLTTSTYHRWKKSCTVHQLIGSSSGYILNIIQRVSTIQAGAGCLSSTVPSKLGGAQLEIPATLATGQVDLLVCRQPKAGPRRPWCFTRALPAAAISGGPNLGERLGPPRENHPQTQGFPHLC